MYRYALLAFGLLLGVMASAPCSDALADEPAVKLSPATPTAAGTIDFAEPNNESVRRVSLAVARDRAKLLQAVYMSTLDVIHERYFHGDRAIVPARAMQDIFTDMKQQTHIEASWISVNLKAMSIDHEPQSEFEKFAAREIAKGKKEVELVQESEYYRATAVSLSGGCISCHDSFLQQSSTSKKFAGLILRIPIQSETPIEAAAPSHK